MIRLRRFAASAGQVRARLFAASAGLLVAAALITIHVSAQVPDGPPPAPERPAPVHPPLTNITSQDHLDGFKNTSRWLTYSGDYTGRRHSPLTQITPANVTHWHGAAPNSHAVQLTVYGGQLKWGAPVTDAEYQGKRK